VDRLLACLNPGGLAVLHIPLAMPDYQFDAASYLADSESGNGMEIHILPKSDLNVLAERNGCQIVFSECIGGVDIAYSEDIVFKKKD
jgi:hypothetical protein